MDETLARASVLVARHVDVKDPTGRAWTIHICRTGEPRSGFVRNSNLYFTAVTLNRIRRLLRRDRTWDVELMRGPFSDDRTNSRVWSNEANKDVAIDAAVRLALDVQAGSARV